MINLTRARPMTVRGLTRGVVRRVSPYIPAVQDGLLLHLPLVNDEVADFSSHGGVVPSTMTVDGDGTYAAKNGTITQASANRLRLERLGVLIEPTAINLLTKTQDLSHSVWAGAPGTPDTTASSATAPDGSTTAWEITDNSAAFWEALQQLPTMVSNTTPIVSSAYIKKESSVLGALPGIRSRAGSTLFIVSIHPVTGVTTAITGFGTVLFHYSVDRGDWWKVVVAGANTSETITDIVLYAALATEGAPSTAVATAQGGPYTFWNPQLEQSDVASSVIPTDTASVTRSADVLDYASAGNLSGTRGSLIIAATPNWDYDTALSYNPVVLDTVTGGQDGVILDYLSTSDQWRLLVYSGGVLQSNITASSTHSRGDTLVFGCVYEEDNIRLYIDGVEVGTTDTISDPVGTSFGPITIGNTPSTSRQFGGTLAHLMSYDRVLSASEMLHQTKQVQGWMGV